MASISKLNAQLLALTLVAAILGCGAPKGVTPDDTDGGARPDGCVTTDGGTGNDGGDESPRPIIQVTYDFTALHTMATAGDTWDTAWAPDDNLYTTYCDGNGFSQTWSDLAIAKVSGNVSLSDAGYDEAGLAGGIVNNMVPDYGLVCGYPWWKSGGLTSVDGVLYLFAAPNSTEQSTGRQLAGAASLVKSTNLGKTWSAAPEQYALDQSSNFNFQDGTLGQWTVSIASDGGASVGFKSDAFCKTPVSGHYAILEGLGTSATKTLSGLAPNTHYRLMAHAWTDGKNTVRVGVKNFSGSLDTHDESTSTSASFMNALHADFTTDSRGTATVYAANVAGSKTGTVYAGLFRLFPSTFPGPNFGDPVFVKYGQDGAGTADGADQYVYAMSNNGYFSNGDYAILGRVSKAAIGKLRDGDWQFYKGGDGLNDASWTSPITDPNVTKLLDAQGGVGMMDVAYIAPLGRYVMLEWGWLQRNSGRYARQGTTVLDTYEAPHPWGPWTKLGSLRSVDPQAFYDPHIITKFVSVDPQDPNLVHALVSTAGEWDPNNAPGKPFYKLTLIPVNIVRASH